MTAAAPMALRLLAFAALAAAGCAARAEEPTCPAAEPGCRLDEDASLMQLKRMQTATTSPSTQTPPEMSSDLNETLHDLVKAAGADWPGNPLNWYRSKQELLQGAAPMGSFNTCTLSGTNSCPMSSFGGKKTIVSPGGETSCLETGPGGFAFLVTPGATSKLLFYMQGGGACWDVLSYDLNACTKDIQTAFGFSGTATGAGVFNTSDAQNAYKDYTIVEILYCSGDGHVGNTTRHFTLSAKGQKQVGYQNVKATLAWALENVDPTLAYLTISGDSAGALGTQGWANLLLQDKFKYLQATVLVDSYAGVFPEGTTGPTLKGFGSCDLPIFTPGEQTLCHEGTLTIQDFMSKTIEANCDVPFAFLQSKEDATQRGFYDLIYFTYDHEAVVISGKEFYKLTNDMFELYNHLPNFVEFYINGDFHTFTELPQYYTAGTLGPVNGSQPNQPFMYDWVSMLSAKNRRWLPRRCGGTDSECSGVLAPNDAGLDPSGYCDSALFPKSCQLSSSAGHTLRRTHR